MKTKNIIIITIALALVWSCTGLAADTDSNDARPYIGVMLDAAPLPDLLVKHLGLEPGQGIRIANIHRGSPADKAGLERDDIIIGFEGKDVDDRQQFVEDVRKAGIGTEISLEIIHLGKREPVKLKLEGLKGDFDLKYPPEPEIVQSWRPGKIFRLKPGDETWREILRDSIPSEFDVDINRLFRELYSYHYSDGEDYTITIEGSPDDDDSVITVQTDHVNYRTTLGEIDKRLPEKYRESAKQAVKNARETGKWKKLRINIDKLHPYWNLPTPPFGPGNEMFDAIKKQMKELQQRLDKLEKWHKNTPDSNESDEPESQQQKDSSSRDKENEKVT